MNLKEKTVKKQTLLMVASAALLISACNTDQYPIGAKMRITPEIKTINIDPPEDLNQACTVDPNRYQDFPLNIVLTDGQDSPIGDAEVSVYVDFSGNTYGGLDTLQLYEDKNGNGVVDVEFELVSDYNAPIFRTRTDTYHGNTVLILRMNLSCTYRGSVFAYAGSVSATANVEVAYDTSEISSTTAGGSGSAGSTDGGTSDDGAQTDAGGVDGGTTDDGLADDGGTDSGTTDNGQTDDGGTDSGTTDNGQTDDGGTDSGTTDNGQTDDAGDGSQVLR